MISLEPAKHFIGNFTSNRLQQYEYHSLMKTA